MKKATVGEALTAVMTLYPRIYFACHTSDPSIHYGTATFFSRFTLKCTTLAVTDEGSYTVTWDNGRTTVVAYTAKALLPAVAPAYGTVISGEFKGARTLDLDFNAPLDSRICTDRSGAIAVGGAGVLTIG